MATVVGGQGKIVGEVLWGDETTESVSVESNTIELIHTYPSSGTYAITINVTDSLGTHASDIAIFDGGAGSSGRLWLIIGLTVMLFIVVLVLIAYVNKKVRNS